VEKVFVSQPKAVDSAAEEVDGVIGQINNLLKLNAEFFELIEQFKVLRAPNY